MDYSGAEGEQQAAVGALKLRLGGRTQVCSGLSEETCRAVCGGQSRECCCLQALQDVL